MLNDPALMDLAVVNASPLIVLFKSGLDVVLPGLFRTIIVPDSVYSEVTACDDKACKGIKRTRWLTREKVETNRRILLWNLGKGESEVLSWGLNHMDYIAVVDDLAARKCSTALNIRHIGTAGILVLAGRHQLIPSLETAFSNVRDAGLYLSDDLVNRLIAAEG